jgi:hypothetical protein
MMPNFNHQQPIDPAITRIVDFAQATYKDKVLTERRNRHWLQALEPPAVPHNTPDLSSAKATVVVVRGHFSGKCSQQDLQVGIDQWVESTFPIFTPPYKDMVKYNRRYSERIYGPLDTLPTVDACNAPAL